MKRKVDDPFLEKRLVKYDQWLSGGQISCSSRVVPVAESLQARQWVLPTEQVLEILRNAGSAALQKCECRTHYGRCDKPLEVCFLLNGIADRFVAKGLARPVSLSEAVDVLRKANESGLIHLSLYMPHHEIYALCSCCPCCCHELQLVRLYGRKDLLVYSEYVTKTDMETCVHCGDCVGRCFFGARTVEDGRMVYSQEACAGCGLCVTVCPVQATVMQPRES